MSILSMPTFSSAPMSYCVMMASSPSAPAPGALGRRGAHRHVLGERARRDDHAGRVHRRVPRDPSIRERQRRPAAGRPDSRVTSSRSSATFCTASGIVQAVRRARRDQLGEPVHLARRDPEHPRHVRTAARAFIVPNVMIWPDAVAAVALAHVLDHLAAALEAEVDVDVGHRHPLGIQEALEQQVELERVDVGDAERVGDERAGRRAAARARPECRGRAPPR